MTAHSVEGFYFWDRAESLRVAHKKSAMFYMVTSTKVGRCHGT